MAGPFDQLFTRGQAPLPQMPEPMDLSGFQKPAPQKLPGFWEALKAGLIEDLTGREERRNRRDLTDVSIENARTGSRNASVNESQEVRAGDKYKAIELPTAGREAEVHANAQTDRVARDSARQHLKGVSLAAYNALVGGGTADDYKTPEQKNQEAIEGATRGAAAADVGFYGASRNQNLPVMPGMKPIAGALQQKTDLAKMETDQQIRQEAAQPRTPSPTSMLGAAMRMSDDWDQTSKDARTMQRVLGQMDRAVAALNSGDQSAIPAAAEAVQVMFQKILDPTSVVREGEFARSLLTQPFTNRVRGALDRLTKGGTGIPISELQQYAELAKQFGAAAAQDLGRQRQLYSERAERMGLNPADIFMNDIGAKPAAAASGPTVGTERVINGVPAVWDGKGWVKK
jgi:hypothetical protein